MLYKNFIYNLIAFLLLFPATLQSQTKPPFSGDISVYGVELTTFLDKKIDEQQRQNLNIFLTNWNKGIFNIANKTNIIAVTNRFAKKSVKQGCFNNLFITLNAFVDKNISQEILAAWLKDLKIMVFNQNTSVGSIDKYVAGFSRLLENDILNETSSKIRWTARDCKPTYAYDSTFKVILKNASIVCHSQRDSTVIYDFSGTYYPVYKILKADNGRISFEKAGFSPDEISVAINKCSIDVTKNTFSIDSAQISHYMYFKTPVYGKVIDKAVTYRNKNTAAYPYFETYEKEFNINNIYKGIDYNGGITFEGAGMKGSGSKQKPAKVLIYRNDTLYMKLSSIEYSFTKTGLASSNATMVLYLDRDSIYHTSLGMSYNDNDKRINLYQTHNPVSTGPYFDSYHKLDMYFEQLSWKLNEPEIILSKTMGSSLGQAIFESADFFNENYYYKLAGMDKYHPLVRLQQFAEYYYSNTFPVEEFAKWLNKPPETVTSLCIDMAKKGFIFYDRTLNEITLKDKTINYLSAILHRKDYDAISIYSETKGKAQNAMLNLNDFKLNINGVSSVMLSDSQNVAIHPYQNKLSIDANRKILFNGILNAGLFTIYGHNFLFDYDTFKVDLQKIDSIKVSVENKERDKNGNIVIEEVSNIIKLTSAELYIDDPRNKSGQKDFKQYPILNTTTPAYIFYDDIPGLKNIYKKKDFYFQIKPFNFESIDHFLRENLNLEGEFYAANILEPMRQYLTIQEDNSLGFNMNVPAEGIPVYKGQGVIYENLSMQKNGLKGSGTLAHLTSVTKSDLFSFYPDSMIAEAKSFTINNNGEDLFPEANSSEASIKWLPKTDQFIVKNRSNNKFNMFGNGTSLDGELILASSKLKGSGIINTTDSKITSNMFSFTSSSITADTSTYNLKSPSTDGYAFIAENAAANIDFHGQLTAFHLNTDTSVVIFPEIQYNCTMTDFRYNMATKIMEMEQRGKSKYRYLNRQDLLKKNFDNLDKPTFFATNMIGDTISFASWKAKYNIEQEYIIAEDITYIHIADALIQPDSGSIRINRRADILPLKNATVAINNTHLLHSATLKIESAKKYSGSAKYDYIDEDNNVQEITFSEVAVDTMTTHAQGDINEEQHFQLSRAFTFSGDVDMFADKKDLRFTGTAGIINVCDKVTSYPVKFKSFVDPKNIMIPIDKKPRNINDEILMSGPFISIDSLNAYPAFLSPQKSWSDVNIVSANGFLWFDKAKNRYMITSANKIADPSINGNMISLDNRNCSLSSEGTINFGTNFGLASMVSVGDTYQSIDSGNLKIHALLAFDFYFSDEATEVMANEISLIPTLKPVNVNNSFYHKAMNDLIGEKNAEKIRTDVNLYGMIREIPDNLHYRLILNDVNLYWNESSSSFRSEGKIGIGFIGTKPINVYVDGYIEIQKRISGDMFDIYLKANESTWYYFSYMRGNLMSQANNSTYNSIIANARPNNRKHPKSSVREPYTYMISVEDKLPRFLRRMEENSDEDEETDFNDEFNPLGQ